MDQHNNINDPIFTSHFQDQFDAAVEQTTLVNAKVSEELSKTRRGKATSSLSFKEIMDGYLMEEWTWFANIANYGEEDPFSKGPDRCEHVDPLHPAMWVGLLNLPNKLWCVPCGTNKANEDHEVDKATCDRCRNPETREFFDFSLPIGNIQIIGSICRTCVSKLL